MKIIPKINKKNLLIVAAGIWFFAGAMLMYRGLFSDKGKKLFDGYKLLDGLIFGSVFYVGMFRKIVKKHTARILSMNDEKQAIYRFFDKRSYILMFSMISAGVLIRISGIVPFNYLSAFYVIMGVPLLLSGFSFIIKRISVKS